jgi:Uncharacterized protein conserved in bacteria
MSLVKIILIVLGTLSLGIGIIGIVVPGLPTTPFLLLTAGLYVKSSDRLYQKLISNRYVGSYILEYQANKGMTKRAKLYAIGLMWAMITLSCLLFIHPLSIKLVVVAVGAIGTAVMGFVVPTVISSKFNK